MADDNYFNFTSLPELDVEAKKLERQRAVAAAMQQQSMQPSHVQMLGRVAVAPSWTEGLAKVAQAYYGRQGQERADQGERDIATQRNIINGQQIGDYFKGDATMTPEDADKYSKAVASGNPTLIAMVAQSLKAKQALAEKTAEANVVGKKDLLQYTDPNKIPDLVNGATPTAGFSPKRETKEVGGVLYDIHGNPTGTGSAITPVTGTPQMTTKMINGDTYEVNPMNGSMRKLDNAPKVTVNNSTNVVNKGETEFSKKLGGNMADQVTAAQSAKLQGQKTLAVVNQLEDLDKRGVFSGPAANASTILSAIAQSAGLPVDAQKLANSQEYQGVLAQQISTFLTAGSGVGRSMTDADREAIQKQFPQLISSPEGRRRIISSLREAATKDIEFGNQVQQKLKENPDFKDAANFFDLAPAGTDYPTGVHTAPGTKVIQWGN